MTLKQQLSDRLLAWFPVAWVIKVSKQITLPGFDGLSLFVVADFFIKGLTQGYITTRAAAIICKNSRCRFGFPGFGTIPSGTPIFPRNL
jgi:hypothetical protein